MASSSKPFAGAESGSPERALEAGKRGSPGRAVQAGIRGKRLMCYPSSNITYCIACLLCIGVILLNKFNSIQFSDNVRFKSKVWQKKLKHNILLLSIFLNKTSLILTQP